MKHNSPSLHEYTYPHEAKSSTITTIRIVEDKTKSERKMKKLSRMCYFELCFNQTLFWKDLSQKVIFIRKDIFENDCKQLELERLYSKLFCT